MRLFRVLLQNANWNRIVSKAEKLVGYSGSYANAQYLFNDEVSHVALNIRKLISSGHPLLEAATHLYSNENFVHIFGLTVLLVSRAANPDPVMESSNSWGGILDSQRSLAEITEVIYTANFIHRGILNADEMPEMETAKLIMGNKMAVLGGDLLLANASVALAKLRQPFIVNEIAQSIADMTASLFVTKGEATNIEQWERQVYLGAGSLVAHACRSTVRLAGRNEKLENHAFSFAKFLTSIVALNYNFSLDRSDTTETKDWQKLRTVFPLIDVTKDEALKLASKYSAIALDHLREFPYTDARRSLVDMTNALAVL